MSIILPIVGLLFVLAGFIVWASAAPRYRRTDHVQD